MNTPPRRPRRRTAKDIRREETRGRLLDVARRLFSAYGYDDVSVTEIGQEAGVSHSMINVYFGGKAGLLYEIVRENNAPQYEETLRIAERPGTVADRLSALLRAWADGDTSDPRLLAIMQSYSWVWPAETEAENRESRGRFVAVLERLVRDGVEDGSFRAIDPATAAAAIWAIYTWGVRAAVFDGAGGETCHAGIMRQVDLLLKPTG